MHTSDVKMEKPEMFSYDEARGCFLLSASLCSSARDPNEMMNGSVRNDGGSLSTGG